MDKIIEVKENLESEKFGLYEEILFPGNNQILFTFF